MERKRPSAYSIYITVMLLIIAALLVLGGKSEAVNAGAKLNKVTMDYRLMKQTVRQHYGNAKIKIVNGNGDENKYWDVILHRKNKDYIVVEKVVSTGNGTEHGWFKTKDGTRYIIGYNKKVPKGKRVISYLIWNPKTNYYDDVVYAIDSGKVRG